MEGWQTQLAAVPATEQSQHLRLTVLLPAYNEEQAIGRVLGEIVEALADESVRLRDPGRRRRLDRPHRRGGRRVRRRRAGSARCA